MEEIVQEQGKKQWEDNLKPHQFKPGQSGNPGGRPKGSKSMKTFAREYLESLTDEEKLEFLKGMDKIDVFKMAEGNPKNETEMSGELTMKIDPEKRKEVEKAINEIIGTD